MAATLEDLITKQYLLESLEAFTRDVILTHFVKTEEGKYLISEDALNQITTNANEIEALKQNLNAGEGGSGATEEEIAEIVAAEVAKIIAGADTNYDTLKEVSDWILGHENSAAAMNTAINSKGDDLEWDENDNTLSLKSGSKTIKQVKLTGLAAGGEQGNYVVEPTFTMDWDTNHLIMTGGKGLVFNIRQTDGHLESEVL